MYYVKTLKMVIFNQKWQKMALNGQNFFFSYSSYIILPKEYPINTDALIL